jgi:predicted phosphate transport protein (TIGR00153 family)
MFRYTAKEAVFFDLFIDTATDTCRAAEMLEDLMNHFTNIQEKVQAIEDVEHTCDGHVHEMLEHLNRSFVTPIDREDIYMIAKVVDNITDDIESTAHRFTMFNINSAKDEAKKLTSLIVQSTKELKGIMEEFKHMKTSKSLNSKIIEVNRIEDEGDEIYRSAVKNLFASETNPIEVIKWKEIYEFLENTLDACEDVANIIEGGVMKHA